MSEELDEKWKKFWNWLEEYKKTHETKVVCVKPTGALTFSGGIGAPMGVMYGYTDTYQKKIYLTTKKKPQCKRGSL